MHVADLLASKMFDVEIAARPASASDVFPDWNVHDRFGVLVYEPLGGIGATHLIQVACALFYDCKPARRSARKIYPEIYAIHVGQWWGTHAAYDFWPSRREHLVTGDHRDVLDAINDRGITRLAIPERPVRDVVHRNKEVDAALDRLATTLVYSPTGRTSNADLTIGGNDKRTEINPQRALRPVHLTEAMTARAAKSNTPIKEAEAEYRDWLRAHDGDVSAEDRAEADRRRESLREKGTVRESYRFIAASEALKCL